MNALISRTRAFLSSYVCVPVSSRLFSLISCGERWLLHEDRLETSREQKNGEENERIEKKGEAVEIEPPPVEIKEHLSTPPTARLRRSRILSSNAHNTIVLARPLKLIVFR